MKTAVRVVAALALVVGLLFLIAFLQTKGCAFTNVQ